MYHVFMIDCFEGLKNTRYKGKGNFHPRTGHEGL